MTTRDELLRHLEAFTQAIRAKEDLPPHILREMLDTLESWYLVAGLRGISGAGVSGNRKSGGVDAGGQGSGGQGSGGLGSGGGNPSHTQASLFEGAQLFGGDQVFGGTQGEGLMPTRPKVAAQTRPGYGATPSAPGGIPSAPGGIPSATASGKTSATATPGPSGPNSSGVPSATGKAGGAGMIFVWCDGSANPNPGKGGWGAILEENGQRREISGASPQSTNNIMELTAALEALRATPQGARVRVATDSQYVVNGITQWVRGWKRKGWKKADGEPVLNQELWAALDRENHARRVEWEWVRGHVGHPENERADALANQARIQG